MANADVLSDHLGKMSLSVKQAEGIVKTQDNNLSSKNFDCKEFLCLLDDLKNGLSQSFESANIISECSQHQVIIADDVLHLSKLNMNLVTLAQINFNPLTEVLKVLKMNEADIRRKNTKLQMRSSVSDAYHSSGVQEVCGDPARFRQIVINLITNAIRFTRKAIDACIVVELDIQPKPPPWSLQLTDDPSLEGRIFLVTTIRDNGLGMTKEELEKLFQKFTQANSKTVSPSDHHFYTFTPFDIRGATS